MIEYRELVNDLYYSLIGKSIGDSPALSWAGERGLLLDKEGALLTFDQPLGAQLEITSRCDLKCLHCYNNSGACADSRDLTDEEWLRVAEELKDMKVLSIVISGGEPFLRPKLLQRLIEAVVVNARTTIGVITNGSFVNQSFIDWFASLSVRNKWIQVSIDGAYPEEHDWQRGVQGSWKSAVQTAYRLSRAGISVRIAHACNRKNFRNLEKMAELSVLMGCQYLVAAPVFKMGRAFLNRQDLLLDEAHKDEFAQLGEHCIRTYSRYLTITVNTAGLESPDYYLRLATLPTAAALIRADGKVQIDCAVPVVFGTVRKRRLQEIWNEAAKYGWQSPAVMSYVKRVISGDSGRPIPCVDDDIMWDKNQ